MHVKRIHEMVEKLTECTKEAFDTNQDHIGSFYLPDVVDMIKDLCEAEKSALEAKELKKEEEEDEAEEKYFLKMLKEEKQDEYKKMKEEYGDGEETDKRFYDRYRYKNGRFAPKGRGTRRGYEEPPYYHVMPEDMAHDPEYWRDVDREKGRLYYTPMNIDGKKGADGGNYADGYSDGQTRGYSDGYEKGMTEGRKSGGAQSRYDRAKRGYEETKEMHKGNTPEDTRETMKGLEELLSVVGGDIKEISPKMSPSEKAMTAQKLDTWSKMLKQ